MGKANHLKPIHTGGTASITTRRELDLSHIRPELGHDLIMAAIAGR